ncbi:MAG: hypothetical protein MI867_22865 [Pseudomonadales bacterium]|nr:hypothetical protein [Pseudomonadales bacterium]
MSSLHDWRPDLRIKSSRRLLWVNVAFHSILLALVASWSAPIYLSVTLAVVLILHGINMHRQSVSLTGSEAVMGITWCEDGWILKARKGLLGPYELASSSRITADIIVLHFKRPSRLFEFSKCCLLLPDSIDSEDFRRLQVFLRWQRPQIRNPLGRFKQAGVS